MEGLEHDADIATAKARQRILIKRGEILARHLDHAGIGTFEAGHHHQQGRLAAAGGADQADCLTTTYFERDVLEDMNARGAAAEREIDAVQRNGRTNGTA